MDKDNFIKEETVKCEEYIYTLTMLKSLLQRICYENDPSFQAMQELQEICDSEIITDVYVDVIIPNLEIVVPLTTGELKMIQIENPEDVKLCQNYIKIVDLCEDVLGLLKSSPDAVAS